ncbi:MAG: ankyrin repeat domain-containing protein [Chloroflexota bacterium]|nr:ankyrin repeat domain-containing protein [Chloroflexota bacterium]
MAESPASPGLDALAAAIERLKQRIESHGAAIERDETRTRLVLVDPLLNALGWDTTDPATVIPEHQVGRHAGKTDYVLRKMLKHDGSPIIAFIGTKRLNEPLENHRAQMLTQANMACVEYACLTNGDRWEVYEVFKEAPLHERPLLEVSIRREPAIDCAVKLQLFKLPALETSLALSPRAARQLLSEAVEAGASSASIRQLLDQDDSLRTWVEYGETPLHSAAREGVDPAVIARFLDLGADAGAITKRGHTPLHFAAMYTLNPAVSALLLDHGADIEAVATVEVTTVDGSLLTTGRTPLHIAAEYNENSAVCALLLDRGADITATDHFSQISLHLAARHNINPAVVSLLLDRGADIAATDHSGQTSLHLAAAHNENPAVSALLLDYGADVDAKDNAGWSPLHHAAAFNANPAGALLLLDAGADIAAVDNGGQTSLHLAALRSEEPEMVTLLLDSGADIQVRNSSGEVPLHCAVQGGNLDVIEYLLKRGAAVGERVLDMFGWTALHLTAGRTSAGFEGYRITKKLLRSGADPNVLTHDGKTPYQIAVECGAGEEVLRLLRE